MTWFKVDDSLPDHRKVRKAGTAMGLWVLCGAWSSRALSGGFVPTDIATRYGTARQAARLVAAGLWVPAVDGDEEGWQFHDWSDYQPSREEVLGRRRAAADRQARSRARRSGQDVTRDEDRGHASPDPTRPDPDGSYADRAGSVAVPDRWAAAPPSARRRMPGPDHMQAAVSLVAELVPTQPSAVTSRLVDESARLLAEGLGVDQVGHGLRLWATKAVGAGLLPEIVGEAMRAPTGNPSKTSTTDSRVNAALKLAERFAAEESAPATRVAELQEGPR
ncbi:MULTISPECIES: hypothetical protein [unclassified Crossiella]|uniref:hypothetical protein n=1 Tax=unclassified Crossiella TaxID=2620835 RepID=UPI001FFE8A34|nr:MULTISPECIES: hypothetical protein [unclassified Crossiella]MCK2237726.1 hypothetical protein [Crossiella sp. S99.2]MCK2255012.1 hypothetical protein [Crossiella sp. S99.1]